MDRLFSWNFVSFGSVVNSTSMVTWQAGERAFSDIGTLIRPQSRRFWYLCLFQQNEAWDKKAKKRILMRAGRVCAYSSKHQPLSVLLRYGNSYDVEWGSFFSDCLSLLLLQSQHNIQGPPEKHQPCSDSVEFTLKTPERKLSARCDVTAF